MKKIVALAFGICLMGGAVSAQTLDSKYGLDSVKTLENASIYSEFLKQKNYKEALPAWRYVFNNAPKFQMLTYTKGEDLLINIYQQTKDKTYVDTLMMLYDQWANILGIIKGMEKVIFWERKGLLYIVSEGMILKKQLFLIWLNHSSSKVIKLTRSRCKPCFSEPGIC